MPETISTMLAQNVTIVGATTAYVTDQDSAATTIAAGSNGATLPQATINVASGASLTASGKVKITTSLGDEYITYTGKGAGTITGCSGGLGVMSTGGAVVQVRVVTFNPGIYRIFLAATGASGTEASPYELLAYVKSVLRGASTRWNVAMASTGGVASGKVRLTYSGTGTGTIAWVASNGTYVIPTILGFASAQITFSAGGTSDGTNPPTHCVFSNARSDDSGIKTEFAGFAGSSPASGIPIVVASNTQVQTRMFALVGHPTRPVDATSLGSILTPTWPDDADAATALAPTQVPAGDSKPWCMHYTLTTASMDNRAVAMTPGYFQALVAGSQTTFDVGRLGVETRKGVYSYFAPNYKRRTTRTGIIFNFTGPGTVA